ncbi:hypothetical protein ACHQM5_002247 [Ranunculus cassubicifolius]
MLNQKSPSPQTSFPPSTTTDSEHQVVFADPCSMCGTKKRRVCPLHQTFDPRKKLFTEPPASNDTPATTSLPLFHINSVCQGTFLTQTHSESSPTTESSNENGKTLPPMHPDSSLPEKTTQRASSVGHLSTIAEESSRDTEDCSSETDESQNTSPSPAAKTHRRRSPVSASKPPRPPKRHESVTNHNPKPASPSRSTRDDDFPVRSPDSDQTRSGGRSSDDKESWNAVKECLGMFTKLMSSGLLNNLQEKPPQEIIQQKKGIMELIDSENILKGERGVYKGSCQCSCGKKYQMILSILPE